MFSSAPICSEYQILQVFFPYCVPEILSFFIFIFLKTSSHVLSASFRRSAFLLPQLSSSSVWKMPSIHCHIRKLILYSSSALFSLFLMKCFCFLILSFQKASLSIPGCLQILMLYFQSIVNPYHDHIFK